MSEPLRFVIEVDDHGSPVIKHFSNSVGDSEKNAVGAAGRMSSAFSSASATIAKSTALISAGFAASGAAIFALTKHVADSEARFQEMSRTVGVTTETLSALQYAAEQEGVSFETLTTSLTAAQRRISEAADGNKAFADSFKALGVSVRDASGNVQSAEDLLPTIAEHLSKVTDESKRTQLAFDIFGRSGTQLLPVLDKGAKGLEAYTERAKELGIIVSGSSAEAAKGFTGAMTDLQRAVTGLERSIGNQLIPVFTPLIGNITDVIIQFRNAGDASGLFAKVTIEAMKFTGQSIALVGNGLARVVEGWYRVDQATSAVLDTIVAGYQGFVKVQRSVGIISSQTADQLLRDLDRVRAKLLDATADSGSIADSIRDFRKEAGQAFDVLSKAVDKSISTLHGLGDATNQAANKAAGAIGKASGYIVDWNGKVHQLGETTKQTTDSMTSHIVKVSDTASKASGYIIDWKGEIRKLGDATQQVTDSMSGNIIKVIHNTVDAGKAVQTLTQYYDDLYKQAVQRTSGNQGTPTRAPGPGDILTPSGSAVPDAPTSLLKDAAARLKGVGIFKDSIFGGSGFGKVGDRQAFASDAAGLLKQLMTQTEAVRNINRLNTSGTIGYRDYVLRSAIDAQSQIAGRLLSEGLSQYDIYRKLNIPSGFEKNFTAFRLPNRALPGSAADFFSNQPAGSTTNNLSVSAPTTINVTGIDPKNLDASRITSELLPAIREAIRRGELRLSDFKV